MFKVKTGTQSAAKIVEGLAIAGRAANCMPLPTIYFTLLSYFILLSYFTLLSTCLPMQPKLYLLRFQKFLLPLLLLAALLIFRWETSAAATQILTPTPTPYPSVTPTVVTKPAVKPATITTSVIITPTAVPGAKAPLTPTIVNIQTSTMTGVISIARTITATKPLPLRLQIPKLKVDAAIESVGSAANGSMGIPKKVDNVA